MGAIVAWTATITARYPPVAGVPAAPVTRRINPLDYDVVVAGATFEGVGAAHGDAISIGPQTASKETPDRRLQVRIGLTDEGVRVAYATATGPADVTVDYIFSADDGLTWQSMGIPFHGRVSNPVVEDGVWTADLEAWDQSVLYQQPDLLSHESQQLRDPTDFAMENTAELVKGSRRIVFP